MIRWQCHLWTYGCFAAPGVKNTTRSATGVQSLLSFESEFAGGIKERMVDTETGTCMHMRHILLGPGDFRFFGHVSRMAGAIHPMFALVERASFYLIFLGLHV